MKNVRSLFSSTLTGALAIGLVGCAAEVDAPDADEAPPRSAGAVPLDDADQVGATSAELATLGHDEPSEFTLFSFTSAVSTSGLFADGDVRLDSVVYGDKTLRSKKLEPVKRAKILIDDGVDVARGGHNFASGQGINSALDDWATEGPATITPTGRDLAASLGNFNLTSIVVTRENVGTASLEVTFGGPVNTFFFWERGNTTSPTTANSDLLVEALDSRGRVTASYKLLRSQYSPTGIAITTWNGSFASPSTPEGVPPQLGSAGLALDQPTLRLRLTSVQEAPGGLRDDGPDYKVIGAYVKPERSHGPNH